MTDVVRAVVTGAASGLGLATVTELVARGARVVGIDLAGDARSAAVEATGARFLPCDVTSQDAWDRAVSDIESSLGGIDLLALNAGVMTRSPSEAIDDDVLTRAGSAGYRRVFAVNVDGVIFGLAALRPLLAPGAGVVVTASTAGISGLAIDPFYAATKHAVVGFVRSVAPILAASGLRINALCPGGIDTAIVPDPLRAVVPAHAFRPPVEVARALLAVAARSDVGGTWLLSEDDDLITRYEVPLVPSRRPT